MSFLGGYNSTGGIQLSFQGVYNFTGGIQISFQGVFKSTGGIQLSFQGVYNSTGGIQITFQGVFKSTGGIQISFLGVYNSTGGIQISFLGVYKPPGKIKFACVFELYRSVLHWFCLEAGTGINSRILNSEFPRFSAIMFILYWSIYHLLILENIIQRGKLKWTPERFKRKFDVILK